MITEPLVLIAIGEDRPGLVEKLAAVVADHGGNWLASRMAHLAGQFAGIVEIEVAPGAVSRLVAALDALAVDGLHVTARSGGGQPPPSGRPKVTLEIVGSDRPGLVSAISHALAVHRVNVEDLHTERESAAMSGEMLFRLRAAVTLPDDFASAELRTELEKLADDLMIELAFVEA